MPRCHFRLLLLLLSLLSFASVAGAQRFTPGSLVFSAGHTYSTTLPTDNVVLEYSRNGTLMRTLNVPYGNSSRSYPDYLRAITVDARGDLYAYNGTFAPYMSTYDSGAGSWTHQTYPGWSTANNLVLCGITVCRHYVFATDAATQGNGFPSGIVRFNTQDGTATRFADQSEALFLKTGLDGLLYVRVSGNGLGTPVQVYDPRTLVLLRSVMLPLDTNESELGDVAVDRNGDMYSIGVGNTVHRFSSSGVELAALNIGAHGAERLALSQDGKIAVACNDGNVVLTDTSLKAFSIFLAHQEQAGGEWIVSVDWVPIQDRFSINGSGFSDILWQNSVTGAVSYWQMNGVQAASYGYVSAGVDTNWKIVGTLNLSNNGMTDLLWQNQTTGDISYWLMDGAQFVSAGYLAHGVTLDWKIVGTADLNNDGQPDLLWQNQKTGDISYWLMNGTQFLSAGYVAYGVTLDWKVAVCR